MRSHRPHICFVSPNAYPVLTDDRKAEVIGGAEVQQAIIARGLRDRGYGISFICLDFGQAEVVDIDGIRIYRAFRRDSGWPIIRFVSHRVTSLWACMKRAGADIYYQRTAGMNTGLVAAYCRWSGKKSIFAASGNPNFERNTGRIRYKRDRWLYEYGLMHVDRVLAQNSEQVRLCRSNFGREAALIPNCYGRPTESSGRNGVEILWVGTIRKIKRPELFLEIAAALPAFPFRMIGGAAPGDDGIFESMKTRAARIGNLTFMGFVPYADVDRYFDRAALLINTSESEGFPNTYLQAWSRGIVTVSLVDSGTMTHDRSIGCTESSTKDVIATIGALMANDIERQSIGAQCQRHFELHHTPERILDLYEQVIADLVTV